MNRYRDVLLTLYVIGIAVIVLHARPTPRTRIDATTEPHQSNAAENNQTNSRDRQSDNRAKNKRNTTPSTTSAEIISSKNTVVTLQPEFSELTTASRDKQNANRAKNKRNTTTSTEITSSKNTTVTPQIEFSEPTTTSRDKQNVNRRKKKRRTTPSMPSTTSTEITSSTSTIVTPQIEFLEPTAANVPEIGKEFVSSLYSVIFKFAKKLYPYMNNHDSEAVEQPTMLMRIRKQDPAVPNLDTFRPVTVYSNVQEGPKDAFVEIRGLPNVPYKPESGQFLYDPEENSEEFDAANCFAIARNIKTMFDQALTSIQRIPHAPPVNLNWQWGPGEPLKILPRFRNETNRFFLNARYDRFNRRLSFDVHAPSSGGQATYLSRSYDIVGHETGHAILDSLVPEYLTNYQAGGNLQTAGLHESFADMTVIFSLLWQFDVCEAIMVQSQGGKTLNGGFWVILAENFGQVFGRDPLTQGIRNLNNTLKLSQIPSFAFDGFGVVFTSAVFKAMVDVFDVEKNLNNENPALTLYRVSQDFLKLVLRSFQTAPRPSVTLKQMAKIMIRLEKDKTRKAILRLNFVEREIIEMKNGGIGGTVEMPPNFCKIVLENDN